jgi:site-specific recombinase XerC
MTLAAQRLDLGTLTPEQLEAIIRAHPEIVARSRREQVKDKSYQFSALGQSAADYLRVKRKRLTESSHRDYERGLAHFSIYFADLTVLDHQYGDGSPRNYNKNLSILKDFFHFQILRAELHGDPTLAIERARPRDVYRTTFNEEQARSIIANAEERRDKIALRLLLHYGIRKGTLKAVQFKHFDHQRRRLTTFAKGGKIRELPIPDRHFWLDLERHILDVGAQPNHYLMCARKQIPRAGLVSFPEKAMGDHGLHDWWYARLNDAGIVPSGTTSGERMHKARHSAGQRLLDHSGNLKAVQKLLGHASIQTTADTYTDWDVDQLSASLADALGDQEPSE